MIVKFAWLPIVVWTWRRTPSKALVWLQYYQVNTNSGPYTRLGVNTPEGEKSCSYLGFFSYEF